MPGNARMDRSFVYAHSLAALAAIQLGSFSDLLYRQVVSWSFKSFRILIEAVAGRSRKS